MSPMTRREIENAVRDALARYRIPGTVVVREGFIELFAGDRPVAIETGRLGDDWPNLAPETRALAANELGRRLADAGRIVRTSTRPPRRQSSSGVLIAILVVVVVLVVGFAVFIGIARKWITAQTTPAPTSAGAPRESEADATARQTRVCEATRKRVYAGATVGPLDVDGWVAELWLARHAPTALSASPALRGLVAGDRLTPLADAELAKVAGGKVELVDVDNVALGKGVRAVLFRFSGRYVDGYLDPSGRARFVALADRAAEASGAEMGALYGRCSHLATHELGAWFEGTDAPSAAAALLYAIGMAADVPPVDRKRLGPGGELDALRIAAGALDPTSLGAMVGGSGGSVTASPSVVTVTFPVGGPIRATSASREVARRLHLDAQLPSE